MTSPGTGSSLVLLSLTMLVTSAQGKEDDCQPEVRVARNTAVPALETKTLTIYCPFKDCGMEANVTWCKVDHAALCKPLHQFHHVKLELTKDEKDTHTNILALTFTNLTLEDNGLYRCQLSTDGKTMSTVSHSINVSVTSSSVCCTTVSTGNVTRNQTEKMVTGNWPTNPQWPPYIYICLGIAGFVAMVVVISFLSMRWCEASKHSAKAEKPQSQHTVPLASYQASPRPTLPNRPRSLRTNPVRYSDESTGNNHFDRKASRNKRGPTGGAQPAGSSVPGQVAVTVDKCGLHDDCSEGADPEPSVIVYAALNHKATRDSPVASRTVAFEEQHSEYAAIRVT
ncbi:B- and T-lymphocyte attenuator-like [Scleropages formosus]|uniref:B- and T-lymphocyte attenuator-like n=1 Tax=Scleropages formosus TaxID=113540 RepID=A0A8C9SJM2_SCLFO|nr:B- and T-lymphocyte attenuator-like [Scleropages formosus]